MSRLDLSAIDITPNIDEGVKIIKAYGENHININGEKIEHDVILSSKSFAKIDNTNDILTFLNEFNEAIILIGASNEQKRDEYKSSIVNALSKENDIDINTNYQRFNIETMSLPAACRTYNVLVTEGRNVIALFLLESK